MMRCQINAQKQSLSACVATWCPVPCLLSSVLALRRVLRAIEAQECYFTSHVLRRLERSWSFSCCELTVAAFNLILTPTLPISQPLRSTPCVLRRK